MSIANITFIGGGNMACNIVVGLLANGYDSNCICVTNPTSDKLTFFREKCKVRTTQNNREGATNADAIILAVKPNQVKGVCEELKDIVNTLHPLIISVAVGVRVKLLQQWLQSEPAIVRAMPNTPASVGAGATALFANEKATKEQRNLVESILRAVGLVVWLSLEDQIDEVAALSGSGPAYIFFVMEALQEAGEGLGLPKETVQLLTAQTVWGAARMSLEAEKDLVELRRFVTSPGGTTEQAIKVLKSGNLPELFTNVLKAAVQRAKELSVELEKSI
ncbi:pyrroline-5-carboxylate reductase [Coxiella-like endosymbiont of Rhipicephalus sanguineus]|uniref:pyrroline-5-carboxylate reductase n=1 Tax=Coxiella-like endosymbiont of Rhipicephalus sanguineus TaxID=1955402 RepID=UPI00203B7E60|nr:pyrroline-5-carboxylate reductase [Coxiella-like endosymbiont of Rhipicephalus sanguineus]MBT8506688.1 pyrroline-5-carboxylate reductase [Coxiella-like endosymbiont of Rhipicephalus sanguineus]